ncbi:hypothetical protein ABVT39_027660, partial [Epinephelus coioides]
MPATPFPHPSVHTTTTVHPLTCSRIRPRSCTELLAQPNRSVSLQSRHIDADKSGNTPFLITA